VKVVFAGTPEFARVALDALIKAGWQVPLVLTQPDRPAGRGLKLQASPVKILALECGLHVAQPQGLRLDGKFAIDAAQAQAALQAACADVMLVAAYGLILPQWVLDLPVYGCLNIHASLLPRWRGAAPIHRAIEAGDAHSGITLMQMNAGLDTGDMLLAEVISLQARDTTASLHERLAVLGAQLACQALERLARGSLHPTPQPARGATYARKIEKSEAIIDWREAAEIIERRMRAFDPYPGCSASWGDISIKCWSARVVALSGAPGTVLAVGTEGVTVACGQDAVQITQLQRAGGKRLAAQAFLQGLPLIAGTVLT
jgi:methionyl-tRNA formyltransferase